MKDELKFSTVTVELGDKDENLNDALTAYASLGFVAGYSSEEITNYATDMINEFYFRTIINK